MELASLSRHRPAVHTLAEVDVGHQPDDVRATGPEDCEALLGVGRHDHAETRVVETVFDQLLGKNLVLDIEDDGG